MVENVVVAPIEIDTVEMKQVMLKAVNMAGTGNRVVPMFWSAPGNAKSAMGREVAEELEREYIDVRLALKEPHDIAGMPMIDDGGISQLLLHMEMAERIMRNSPNDFQKEAASRAISSINNYMATMLNQTTEQLFSSGMNQDGVRWTVPAQFPRDPNSTAILALDELPNADVMTQKGAYSLIADGFIQDYRLPIGVTILLMGNRLIDRGATVEMPKPLQNRMLHYTVNLRAPQWIDNFAIPKNMHPWIVGFIYAFPDKLHSFDPSSPNPSFATARTWVLLDKMLKDTTEISDRVFRAMIYGAIGNVIGQEFYDFASNARRLPKPEDIINGKILSLEEISGTSKETDIGLNYQIMLSSAQVLSQIYNNLMEDKAIIDRTGTKEDIALWNHRHAAWSNQVNNYFIFLDRNVGAEITVISIQICLHKFKMRFTSANVPMIATLATKHQDVIVPQPSTAS